MRVISGKYKGKNIMGFNIMGTRPTMDRVKESMFGIIQNKIKNSVCLDLFAGSGSLGIEALSNGASICYFVEKNNEIYNVLKNNLNDVEGSFLIKNDYMNALDYFVREHIKFDVIFLDPPYKLNLINNILNYIYDNQLLSENGIVVCEYESEYVDTSLFELVKIKKYGSKFVKIYKNI